MLTAILAHLKHLLGLGTVAEPPAPRPAPPMTAFERVTCVTCDQWFYRTVGLHPDTSCIDCQMRAWDVWIHNYEAKQAVQGSRIRSVS